jgi:hypothetical protein
MKRLIIFAILSFLIFITGCNFEIDYKSKVPEKVNKLATNFISNIYKGNFETCFNSLYYELKNDEVKRYLQFIHTNINNFTIDSFNIVGYKKTNIIGEKTRINYGVDYEYLLGNKFFFVTFLMKEENNKIEVMAFRSAINDKSMLKINNFSLENKSILHYIFLLLAIVIPMFIIITLIYAIKTKLKWKWLWIIGICFGFIKFSINWETGQSGIDLIHLQIFSAGFSRTGNIGHWILSFSLPIIAIIFWYKRIKLKRSSSDIKPIND